MRAVALDRYVSLDELAVTEAADPTPGPDEAVVRVRAASINPVDLGIVQGGLDGAFPTIWPLIPGWDVAGEVVATGPAVRHVVEGQAVYGYARKDLIGTGSWAELISMPARSLTPAPEALDHVHASCVPLAGMTAWQCLVEDLDVGTGDTVLIHGATGGVGHLGTQIARAKGAEVIGTCSPESHDFLRALGGEPLAYGDGLDERLRHAAPNGVDAIADFADPSALPGLADQLTRPGRLVSVLDPETATSLGGTYVFVRPEHAHLIALADLADRGELEPHVQSAHELADVADAAGEAAGSVQGKVVLTVD